MSPSKPTFCIGSSTFDPAIAIHDAPTLDRALRALHDDDDLAGAVRIYFGIPEEDAFVYHAMASFTLEQAQVVVREGRGGGWYDFWVGEEVCTLSLSLVPFCLCCVFSYLLLVGLFGLMG